MRILILGITGMLGRTLFRYLSSKHNIEVFGTTRGTSRQTLALDEMVDRQILTGVEAESDKGLHAAFLKVRPDVVVNCIGVVKQLAAAEDPLVSIPINSLFPHRIAQLATLFGARVVHISTDCVFSGKHGRYNETGTPDAMDLYGRSKLLGELYGPNAITLRTSIIGHEHATHHGLLEWFLAQADRVDGFSKAIFSGLPTVELARVIHEFVLPNSELSGLYHVAAEPISKLELLRLIAEIYVVPTTIVPSERVVIDRSLDGSRFNVATNYRPPAWRTLIAEMYKFQ